MPHYTTYRLFSFSSLCIRIFTIIQRKQLHIIHWRLISETRKVRKSFENIQLDSNIHNR